MQYTLFYTLHCISNDCSVFCTSFQTTVLHFAFETTLHCTLYYISLHFALPRALQYYISNDCTGDTRSSSVFQCAAPLLFGRPSFLATICPENDQIHGSGQRKQNKQSEAKLGHMTIDLHAGGRQLHKDRRQIFYNSQLSKL